MDLLAAAYGVQGMLQTIPVVDATGLEGAWDFDFKFTSRAFLIASPPRPADLS